MEFWLTGHFEAKISVGQGVVHFLWPVEGWYSRGPWFESHPLPSNFGFENDKDFNFTFWPKIFIYPGWGSNPRVSSYESLVLSITLRSHVFQILLTGQNKVLYIFLTKIPKFPNFYFRHIQKIFTNKTANQIGISHKKPQDRCPSWARWWASLSRPQPTSRFPLIPAPPAQQGGGRESLVHGRNCLLYSARTHPRRSLWACRIWNDTRRTILD